MTKTVGLNVPPCVACEHADEQPSKVMNGQTMVYCGAYKDIITGKPMRKPAFEVRHDPKLCGYKGRWFEKKEPKVEVDADLFAGAGE